MTDDFKKALYDVNPYGQSSDGLHDVFNKGAWWAYRWFTKDKSVHFWASSCASEIKKREALQEQADALAEALEKIVKFNFRCNGPSGCDNHCINHPCGPCMGYASEKQIARKALGKGDE